MTGPPTPLILSFSLFLSLFRSFFFSLLFYINVIAARDTVFFSTVFFFFLNKMYSRTHSETLKVQIAMSRGTDGENEGTEAFHFDCHGLVCIWLSERTPAVLSSCCDADYYY